MPTVVVKNPDISLSLGFSSNVLACPGRLGFLVGHDVHPSTQIAVPAGPQRCPSTPRGVPASAHAARSSCEQGPAPPAIPMVLYHFRDSTADLVIILKILTLLEDW